MVPFHDPELARRLEHELRPRAERARELRQAALAPGAGRPVRAVAERLLALVALRRRRPAAPVAPAVRQLPRPEVETDAGDADARRSA